MKYADLGRGVDLRVEESGVHIYVVVFVCILMSEMQEWDG